MTFTPTWDIDAVTTPRRRVRARHSPWVLSHPPASVGSRWATERWTSTMGRPRMRYARAGGLMPDTKTPTPSKSPPATPVAPAVEDKPNLIGLEQDGIHTTTYDSKKAAPGSDQGTDETRKR